MELDYEQKKDIQVALDKMLVAKYLWDKKRTTFNSKWRFYETNTQIFSEDFWIQALEKALDGESVSFHEDEDEEQIQFLFKWPAWERITRYQRVLDEEELIHLNRILKHCTKFSPGDFGEARMFFCIDGTVSLSVTEYFYTFCHPIIAEILEMDLKFMKFEERVQNRLAENLVVVL